MNELEYLGTLGPHAHLNIIGWNSMVAYTFRKGTLFFHFATVPLLFVTSHVLVPLHPLTSKIT